MNALDEHNISALLEDPDIEFELESDNKQYMFVCSTRIVAKKSLTRRNSSACTGLNRREPAARWSNLGMPST